MTKHTPHTLPPTVINLFFIIGILSALAFRLLIVFTHLKPEWFRPTWYLGIIGYILFFAYRYNISQKRKKTIEEYDLIAKLENGYTLSAAERQAVSYLLASIKQSRENLNYLFIFALSIIAVLLDILLTLSSR